MSEPREIDRGLCNWPPCVNEYDFEVGKDQGFCEECLSAEDPDREPRPRLRQIKDRVAHIRRYRIEALADERAARTPTSI